MSGLIILALVTMWGLVAYVFWCVLCSVIKSVRGDGDTVI